MSLQLAAQHLSNQGRGPDDTLVHMSRNEVKSLNDLAMAHGGQLTINPQTGLPEAGFLSAILPMVAGAFLGPAGFTAVEAGLAVGAGSMLLNPKAGLMGGLMAGLGAYGGAGLGNSLAMEGVKDAALQNSAEAVNPFSASASQGSVAPTPQQIAVQNTGPQGLTFPGESTATGSSWASNYKPNAWPLTGNAANGFMEDPIGMQNGTRWDPTQGRIPAFDSARVSAPMQAPMPDGSTFPGESAEAGSSYANYKNPTAADLKNMTTSERLSAMKQGLTGENLLNFAKENPMQAAGLAAGIATGMQKNDIPTPTVDKDMGQRYTYSAGRSTPQPAPDINPDMGGGSGREQRYYSPSYTKITADEAKSIYGFADGGSTPQNPAVPQFAMPKDNPNAGALNLFKDMQAQSATQAAAQPAPVDVAKDYAAYVKNLTLPSPATVPTEPVAGVTSTIPTGDPNATPSYTYNPATKTFTSVVAPKPITPISPISNTYWQTAMGDGNTNMNYGANGGLMAAYAGGGSTVGKNPVERMSNANAVGANTGFPQAYMPTNQFATPTQTPVAQNVLLGAGDVRVDPYTGEKQMATGGISDARYNLGSYSDGGRLLRGPGDGVSDSIPAVIGKRQPARLADGEFVVPARIVSELGNGSTEAGARKLYAMMDRIQASRKQSIGKGKVAKNSRADKYLPA